MTERRKPGRPAVGRTAKTLSLSLPPRVVDALALAGRAHGKVAARVAAEIVIQQVAEMPLPPSDWDCEGQGHCHHLLGPPAPVNGPGRRVRRYAVYHCCECGERAEVLLAGRSGSHGPRAGISE